MGSRRRPASPPAGRRCCRPPCPRHRLLLQGKGIKMVNNQIASIRKYRKKWQDKVVTWFNQPARKERRRAGEPRARAFCCVLQGSCRGLGGMA